jgi:hypothetical protein
VTTPASGTAGAGVVLLWPEQIRGAPAPRLAHAVHPAPGPDHVHISERGHVMRGLLRTLLAGWGAKKMGGGCISTVIIFIILFWLLGYVF